MKRIFLIILPVLIGLTIEAQKILLLENSKNLRNFKYYRGDELRLKICNKEAALESVLLDMTDSSIDVIPGGIIPLDSIEYIYRELSVFRIFSSVFLIGGASYFAIDSFNRLINNDSPVVLQETAIISGGLVGTGLLMRVFKYRKINIEKNWNLKVLDFDALK